MNLKGKTIMNTNRVLRGLATAALLASAGIALAGCGAGSMPNPQMASSKVPVVSQTMMTFDLGFAPGGSLSSEQRASLAEWFDSIGVSYGDRVSIDDPHSGAAMRRSAVGELLAKHGLLLSDTVPVTNGSVGAGSARVVVLRASAMVPACPDWSRASNPELEASTMSNFGCATVSALAAMVADPNDLVSGKSHTGTDALTTVKSIETYRTKAGTATQNVKSTVGTATSSSSN